MKTKLIYLLIFLVLGLNFPVSAQDQKPVRYKAVKSSSFIKYTMYHPLHTWSGTSRQVQSVILVGPGSKIIKGAVKVKVASFDSHNANRDSHMIDVTEAIKYPYITFVTTNIVDNGSSLKITGILQFHGVKKKITFTAQKKVINNTQLKVTGGFEVKVTDFKIRRPRLMGVPVEDRITLNFNVLYKKL